MRHLRQHHERREPGKKGRVKARLTETHAVQEERSPLSKGSRYEAQKKREIVEEKRGPSGGEKNPRKAVCKLETSLRGRHGLKAYLKGVRVEERRR